MQNLKYNANPKLICKIVEVPYFAYFAYICTTHRDIAGILSPKGARLGCKPQAVTVCGHKRTKVLLIYQPSPRACISFPTETDHQQTGRCIIYAQYARYGPCTILHIGIGGCILFCIFCILKIAFAYFFAYMHQYAK